MQQIAGLITAISSLVLGGILAGAVHEYSHALTGLLLGGKVEWIRPFATSAGQAATFISGLLPFEYGIVANAGMAGATLSGMLAVTLIPWKRLDAVYSLILAFLLLPFALNPLPLLLAPKLHEGDTGVLKQWFPS